MTVALLLVPLLVHAETVRLVSTADVIWIHDGETLGTSNETSPLLIDLPAGRHNIWAIGPDDEAWQALARPEPRGDDVAYVDAWTARHEPDVVASPGVPWAPIGFVAVAGALWFASSKNP